MPRKYFTAEQIISKLREAEVLISQGKTATEASSSLGDQRTNLLSVAQRIWWDRHRTSAPLEGVGKRERTLEATGCGSIFG